MRGRKESGEGGPILLKAISTPAHCQRLFNVSNSRILFGRHRRLPISKVELPLAPALILYRRTDRLTTTETLSFQIDSIAATRLNLLWLPLLYLLPLQLLLHNLLFSPWCNCVSGGPSRKFVSSSLCLSIFSEDEARPNGPWRQTHITLSLQESSCADWTYRPLSSRTKETFAKSPLPSAS